MDIYSPDNVFWATDIDSTCYTKDSLHLTVDSVYDTDFRIITNRADFAADPIFRSFFSKIPIYYPEEGTGLKLPESAFQTGTIRKQNECITYAAAFSQNEKNFLLQLVEKNLNFLNLIEYSAIHESQTQKESHIYKVYPEHDCYDQFISHVNPYYKFEHGYFLSFGKKEIVDPHELTLESLQNLVVPAHITKFTFGFKDTAHIKQLEFANAMRKKPEPISTVVEDTMVYVMAENQDKGTAYKHLAGDPKCDRIEFWSGDNGVDADAALEVMQRENGIVFAVGGYNKMFNEYTLWNKERKEIFHQFKHKIVNIKSPELLASAIIQYKDQHNAYVFLGRHLYQGFELERAVGV